MDILDGTGLNKFISKMLFVDDARVHGPLVWSLEKKNYLGRLCLTLNIYNIYKIKT